MLVQRLRRWPYIKSTLSQHLAFSGQGRLHCSFSLFRRVGQRYDGRSIVMGHKNPGPRGARWRILRHTTRPDAVSLLGRRPRQRPRDDPALGHAVHFTASPAPLLGSMIFGLKADLIPCAVTQCWMCYLTPSLPGVRLLNGI